MVALDDDMVPLMEGGELFQGPDDGRGFLLKGTVIALRDCVFSARIRDRTFLSLVIELEQHSACSVLRAIAANVNCFGVIDVEQQFRVECCCFKIVECFEAFVGPNK